MDYVQTYTASGTSPIKLDFTPQAQRVAEMLLGKPWAIAPEALIEITARLARAGDNIGPAPEAAAGRPIAADRRVTAGGTVAVIPLRGTITPRGSLFSQLFGLGGGLQNFRQSFRQAMADGDVSAVVLDIDSPGGLIDLVPEAAAEIRDARGSKPIVAVSNTLCASAAYWIASQADEVVVTPSGQVGSIGVFLLHEDFSRMEEFMGIKTTIISAGDHKTDGNPYEPLSKGARASLQAQVDDLYGMFTADVAAGRGVSQQAVKAGYGRGSCVLAEQAAGVGLVDSVETLEQVLARLGGAPAAEDNDLIDDVEDTDGEMTAEQTSPEAGDDTPDRAPEDGERVTPTANYLSNEPTRERGFLYPHDSRGGI